MNEQDAARCARKEFVTPLVDGDLNGAEPRDTPDGATGTDVSGGSRIATSKARFLERLRLSSEKLSRTPRRFRSSSRFRRIRELGRGGLGIVHKAVDLEFNRIVAVKESRRVTPWIAREHDPFFREYRLTARLQHPGVPAVFSAGRFSNGRRFYSMRLVEGESLFERIRNHHSVPATPESKQESLADLVDRLAYVCETLQAAHEAGILHLDLKPENVMVEPSGATFVVDWGLAREIDGPPPDAAETCDSEKSLGGIHARDGEDKWRRAGTREYMAPEQGRSDSRLDPRADVFALGGILHAILAGRPPRHFAKSSLPAGRLTRVVTRWLVGAPADGTSSDQGCVGSDLSGAPPELASICRRALREDPADRYPSASALRDDLLAWRRHEVVQAHKGLYHWTERAGRCLSKYRAIARVASLSLAAIAVVSAIATFQVWTASRQAITALEQQRESNELLFGSFEELSDTVMADEVLASPLLQEVRGNLLGKLSSQYRLWTERSRGTPAEYARVAKGLTALTRIELDTNSLERAANDIGLAEEHWRRLWDADGTEANWLGLLNSLEYKVAVLHAQGNLIAAFHEWENLNRLLDETPPDVESTKVLTNRALALSTRASLEYSLAERQADSLQRLHHMRRSLSQLAEVVELRKRLVDLDPQPSRRLDLAQAIGRQALVTQKSVSPQAAISIYAECLSQLRGLRRGTGDDFDASVDSALASALFNSIMAHRGCHDFTGAIRLGREGVDICQQLVDRYPLVIRHGKELARGLGNLADTLVSLYLANPDAVHIGEMLNAQAQAASSYLRLDEQVPGRGFETGAVTYLVRRGFWLGAFHRVDEARVDFAKAMTLVEAPESQEPANLGQIFMSAAGYAVLFADPSTDSKRREAYRTRVATISDRLNSEPDVVKALTPFNAGAALLAPLRDIPAVDRLMASLGSASASPTPSR